MMETEPIVGLLDFAVEHWAELCVMIGIIGGLISAACIALGVKY